MNLEWVWREGEGKKNTSEEGGGAKEWEDIIVFLCHVCEFKKK